MTITTVSQGQLGSGKVIIMFSLMTLFGMGLDVVLVTTAVLSRECPGSVVPYHRRLRGTLKCVFVVMKQMSIFT
jgi:hypothetical protein